MEKVTHDELTVLVTGFESFDDDYALNPSFEIARSLPAIIPASHTNARPIEVIYHGTALPVDYAKIKELIPDLLTRYSSVDMILHIGMAGRRSYFTIEQYAHRDGYNEKKDNSGSVLGPQQGSIDFSDCLDKMYSSFSFDNLLSRWHSCTTELVTEQDLLDKTDLRPSDDAGQYLCDYTYYNSLVWFARRKGAMTDTKTRSRPVMFLHVPGESDEKSLKRGRLAAAGLIRAMAQCLSCYDQPTVKL